jgi:hypothetical protein
MPDNPIQLPSGISRFRVEVGNLGKLFSPGGKSHAVELSKLVYSVYPALAYGIYSAVTDGNMQWLGASASHFALMTLYERLPYLTLRQILCACCHDSRLHHGSNSVTLVAALLR